MTATSTQIENFEKAFASFLVKSLAASNSQLGQDLFALFAVGKPEGYFLDIGASDPIALSNTQLLERYGWNGFLLEPNPSYKASIARERRAELINKAVTPDVTGQVAFDLVTSSPEFSRLRGYSLSDVHDTRGKRSKTREMIVDAISINDLIDLALIRFSVVDFVSIDIEGLEYFVLEQFPFNRMKPSVFCVEHNYSDFQSKIDILLSVYGYQRVCKRLSKWDSWFVRHDVISAHECREPQVDERYMSSYSNLCNITDLSRELYNNGDFEGASGALKFAIFRERVDHSSASILAQCIDLCNIFIQKLQESGRPDLVEKHFTKLSDAALVKLQRTQR